MKSQKMEDNIPGAIKIYGAIVGLLGLIFAYACYFNPAMVAPGAVLDNTAIKLAFYTTGGLVVSLSVGLALAILSNRPESMALILIIRTVAALQDLGIAIVLGLGAGLIIFQIIVIVFGAACIVKLFNIINVSEKQMA